MGPHHVLNSLRLDWARVAAAQRSAIALLVLVATSGCALGTMPVDTPPDARLLETTSPFVVLRDATVATEPSIESGVAHGDGAPPLRDVRASPLDARPDRPEPADTRDAPPPGDVVGDRVDASVRVDVASDRVDARGEDGRPSPLVASRTRDGLRVTNCDEQVEGRARVVGGPWSVWATLRVTGGWSFPRPNCEWRAAPAPPPGVYDLEWRDARDGRVAVMYTVFWP